MKSFIGNILSKSVIPDCELFNVTDDVKQLITGIPTLIIGYERAKSLIADFNIIENNPSSGIFWTFGRMERRSKYEEDLKNFKMYCLNNLMRKVSYKFISLLSNKELNLGKIGPITTVYSNDDMVYAYSKTDNSVFGVSLRDADFCGIPRKVIFGKLLSDNGSTLIGYDDIPSYTIKNDFKDRQYLIPVVC